MTEHLCASCRQFPLKALDISLSSDKERHESEICEIPGDKKSLICRL